MSVNFTQPLSPPTGARRAPDWPGQVLREKFMRPLGLTAYRVAKELSVAPITISEILRGKRAISASMARRLGVYFGVDPLFWMSLQAWHDLRHGNGNNGTEEVVERCEALKGRGVRLRVAQGVLGEQFWSVEDWEVEVDGTTPRRKLPPGRQGRPEVQRTAQSKAKARGRKPTPNTLTQPKAKSA